MKDEKILDLVLTYEYYDKIKLGIKNEEYRDCVFWSRRICTYSREHRDEMRMNPCNHGCLFKTRSCNKSVRTKVKQVRFRRGYTRESIVFEIKNIRIGRGDYKMGAPGYEVFIIELGERVS